MDKVKYLLFCAIIIFGCNSISSSNKKDGDVRDTIVKVSLPVEHLEKIDTLSYLKLAGKYKHKVDARLPYLVATKLDVLDGSSQGGYINIYRDKTDTLKLKAVYYGEVGQSEYTIYLKNSKPIIFEEKLIFYQSPIGKKKVVIDSVIYNRFVLKNNKILIGKKGSKIIGGELEEKENELKLLYKEILSQLNN